MKTFKRICLQSYRVEAENGDALDLERGREYLTSSEKDGQVTVFTSFWVRVPVSLFAGEMQFTKT